MKCELKACKSGEDKAGWLTERAGTKQWDVQVCQSCMTALDLKSGEVLLPHELVERILRTRYRDRRRENAAHCASEDWKECFEHEEYHKVRRS